VTLKSGPASKLQFLDVAGPQIELGPGAGVEQRELDGGERQAAVVGEPGEDPVGVAEGELGLVGRAVDSR
jgi:hypothetical protein